MWLFIITWWIGNYQTVPYPTALSDVQSVTWTSNQSYGRSFRFCVYLSPFLTFSFRQSRFKMSVKCFTMSEPQCVNSIVVVIIIIIITEHHHHHHHHHHHWAAAAASSSSSSSSSSSLSSSSNMSSSVIQSLQTNVTNEWAFWPLLILSNTEIVHLLELFSTSYRIHDNLLCTLWLSINHVDPVGWEVQAFLTDKCVASVGSWSASSFLRIQGL